MKTSLIVGGSSGLGRVIADLFADRGDNVLITSADSGRAAVAAKEIGATGLALDLTMPDTIAEALADLPDLDHLVITAAEQSVNSIADFNITDAVKAVTIKLVSYAETVRVAHKHFRRGASVVLFGGLAKDRPYPGSTMVTTVNQGITGLVKTLAVELAPYRINALHPGIVGNSPKWRDFGEHPHQARTPIGRLVTMSEVADATAFLLRNTGVNAQDLVLDGGLLAQ
jgi:NAD(P)-dependent dehydrogenase (short-subunit alcohol dehydrogenase family)